jgi:CubicO group peptidase (beta-lactamase class C family)
MLLIKKQKSIIFISILVYVFIFSITCIAQNIESKVDEYVNAYMKMGRFSGSILIAQNGNVLVSKGYGMANYEHDVPNTPQTKFRLGSITKQFTSMAIMQLQEKGMLNVDDAVIKYIPDYPETGKKITIHHLLTHTSGILNFTSFPDYVTTMMIPSPVEKTVERFKDKPLEFEPGEKYSYSNSGYVLLGYIIEKVTGASYEKYIQENIFQPLNMKDTGYDHHITLLKHRAAGYDLTDDGPVNADYIDMTIPHAAGALYSTVEDLYTWDRALYTKKLVSRSSLNKIFTAFKNNYGYGWGITTLFNRACTRHGGGINGFRSNIIRFVDDDACIIVLSNIESAPVNRISEDLIAILFGEKYELPREKKAISVESEILDTYVGEYEVTPEFHIYITKENGQLYAAAPGHTKAKMYAESETEFFLRIADVAFTFVKNEKGKVTQLILHMDGEDSPAKKIK